MPGEAGGGLMALFFSPPTAPTVPMAVRPNHPGFGLFRHYRNLDAGINVFVVAGVVTTAEPDYEFTTPDRVYLGGHIYVVTQAESAVLTAAGYTVVNGPDAVVQPGLPGFDDGSFDPNLPTDPGLLIRGVGIAPLGVASLGGQ
jgi:hypothetical protein